MARAADVAYDALREQILGGQLAAGERLREEHLADMLGVSRTPIREALRRLDSEGFVEFVPHRGAHVASWTDADLEEIYTLRATLEGQSAAAAAERATPEAVTELRATAARIEEAVRGERVDYDLVTRLNGEFHAKVLECSGNRHLASMLGSLVQVPLVQRTFRLYSREALRRSAAHHAELVAAIEARDPLWADAVMQAHARSALHATRGAMAPERDRSA